MRKREKKKSAVVHTQTRHAFIDDSRQRMDEVTRSDDMRARMEEAVAEVSTCGRNHKARTITKAVASCNHPAKVDSIKNTTPETPKAPNMPQKNSQALDTGTYKVLRSSQLDRTILARQERETGELTFRLLPKAIMVPVPKGK